LGVDEMKRLLLARRVGEDCSSERGRSLAHERERAMAPIFASSTCIHKKEHPAERRRLITTIDDPERR